jgi:hypothetical protein
MLNRLGVDRSGRNAARLQYGPVGQAEDPPSGPAGAGTVGPSDSPEDLAAVAEVMAWAERFLVAPNPQLGRRGPVCPYMRHSLDEQLCFVTYRTDRRCDSYELRHALRSARQQFSELQLATPPAQRHLVAVLIVLPRIDRGSSSALDALHASLKDEFVQAGLMLGQFHPQCQAVGLWNGDFRPLQSPVPLLAIREMNPSDLPFLVGSPVHASTYIERYAPAIPAHTRRYLVDTLMAGVRGARS